MLGHEQSKTVGKQLKVGVAVRLVNEALGNHNRFTPARP